MVGEEEKAALGSTFTDQDRRHLWLRVGGEPAPRGVSYGLAAVAALAVGALVL